VKRRGNVHVLEMFWRLAEFDGVGIRCVTNPESVDCVFRFPWIWDIVVYNQATFVLSVWTPIATTPIPTGTPAA